MRTTTYRARISRDYKFPFGCLPCGLRTDARVFARGEGQSVAVYGIGGSEDDASVNAEKHAYQTAENLFRACPCPRCGAHDVALLDRVSKIGMENRRRAKVRTKGLLWALGTTGVGLVSFFFGVLMVEVSSTLTLLTSLPGILLFLGGLLALMVVPLSTRAQQAPQLWNVIPPSVRFDRPHGM